MTTQLRVTVSLNAEVPGLPYMNPTLKRCETGFVYWAHMQLRETLFTLFLESQEDINITRSRKFDALAYFMRDDLQLEAEALALLRVAPQPLLNGDRCLGEMEVST